MASCSQIANLLQAWIDDELGHAERVILEQHVGICPACKALARKHQRVAALLFESFGEQRLKRDLTPSILENLPAMEPVSIHVRSGAGRRPLKPFVRTALARYMPAAAAAVLLIVGVVLYFQWPPDPRHAADGAVGVVSQCIGEVTQGHGALMPHNTANSSDYVPLGQGFETGPKSALMLTLRGPTLVKANEKTRLSVGDDRVVHLEEGQVWLKVAKEDRQFKLCTPVGDVTVLGTTFDVIVQGSKAVITVHEGVVQVSNGINTMRVEPGQQAEIVSKRKIEPTRQVEAREVSRWAEALVADTRANAVFSQTVQVRSPEQLPAEQVFVVITKNGGSKRAVSSFELAWEPDGAEASRCGYFVYVYNDRMEELFSEHVSGSLFQNKDSHSVRIPVPGDPISGVSVIHIKLVPDFSTGELKTSFSRISAMGI